MLDMLPHIADLYDKLDMDGCIAFICRTQTWVRE